MVIIGNGIAGMTAAETLRTEGFRGELTIVSEESDHFFSRSALMWVASGQLSHKCIEARPRDHYESHSFTRVRDRVTHIEPGAIHLRHGAQLSFDRLLIACGSKPLSPPFPGGDLGRVGTFVTLQDLEWFESELHTQLHTQPPNADVHLPSPNSPYARRKSYRALRGPIKRPVVIGGGLIGIEVVEVLMSAGLSPRFIVRGDTLWPGGLTAAEARFVARKMRGATVHFDEEVCAFEGEHFEGDALLCRVVTSKGAYEHDFAIVAIGVQPNTEWLANSEIELGPQGAIVVTNRLETSMEGVFAAGDCASVPQGDGTRSTKLLWYTGRAQGRAAAMNMLHKGRPYRQSTPFNSAKIFDMEYTSVGTLDGHAELFFEECGPVRSTTRFVLAGASSNAPLIGFSALGRRWDHELVIRWIEEETPVNEVIPQLQHAAFDTEFVPPLMLPPRWDQRITRSSCG